MKIIEVTPEEAKQWKEFAKNMYDTFPASRSVIQNPFSLERSIMQENEMLKLSGHP